MPRRVNQMLPQGSARRDFAVVLGVLLLVLAAEAVYVLKFDFPARRADAERRMRQQLTIVVNDRAAAVTAWVRERIGDARVAGSYVTATLDDPGGPLMDERHPLLREFRDVYQYEVAYLVSSRDAIVGSRGPDAEPCILEFARLSRAQRKPVVEFCRGHRQQARVVTAVPLGTPGPESSVFVFVSDPSVYLYPAVATWSVATQTGETGLARLEGPDFVALTPVRPGREAPAAVRRRLAGRMQNAMRSQGASLRFIDRRGIPVLAEVLRIDGTRWYLYAKIDEREMVAPAVAETRRLGEVLGLVTGLIACFAFVLLRSGTMSELREAEQNFRRLFENAMNGVFVCDVLVDAAGNPVDHRFAGGNPAFSRLTGVDVEEEIGKTGEEMTLSCPPPVAERIYRVAMTGEPARFEHYDESLGRWFETSAFSPRRGQVAQEITDITARRHAEIILRALSDDSLLGVFSYENDSITYANAAAASMFGYRREEVLGKSPMLVVHPDDQGMVAEHIRKRVVGEVGSETYTFRGWRKDGSSCWIEAAMNPVYRDGRLMVIGNLIEITERMNAQAALRRLAIAVSQLAEGIVITDVAGIVQYVNPAYQQLTGYTGEEVLGSPWLLLQKDYPDSAAIRETLGRGDLWQGIVSRTRKNGTTIEEEVTISPVRDESGDVVNYVAVKRDLTKERNLFAQLLQAQKMEAIGTLAGGVAHDFNNLLQGMAMMVEIATRHGSDEAKRTRTLGELSRLVQRAAALTKQLLLFSRKDVAQPERVDLNAVIRDSAKLLRRLARENVAFTMELEPYELPVRADRGQLEQVLVNLIVNAFDAMPNGGALCVRTKRDPNECTVIIEDTGPGIPPAIRERIFEPFFTTKGKEKGTGLGLSVVHGIITEHGGSVSFEDRPGGGTSFRITLPCATGLTARQKKAAIVPPPGRGERVLVVEDEESVRSGLAAMLELLHYQVVAVGSGTAALRLPRDEPFDVLVSDVVLPDLTGPEIARELTARWPKMKAILMSGYSSDPDLRRKIAASGATLLTKPFELAEIAHALRTALA